MNLQITVPNHIDLINKPFLYLSYSVYLSSTIGVYLCHIYDVPLNMHEASKDESLIRKLWFKCTILIPFNHGCLSSLQNGNASINPWTDIEILWMHGWLKSCAIECCKRIPHCTKCEIVIRTNVCISMNTGVLNFCFFFLTFCL